MDKRDGQASEIGHVVVEQFGRFVHFVVEASVSDLIQPWERKGWWRKKRTGWGDEERDEDEKKIGEKDE